MNLDILSYKEKFVKFEEKSVIQNLTNITQEKVKELLDFKISKLYK